MAIPLFPLSSLAAQVCYDDSVATAFDNTVASAMVVELEQARISLQQLTVSGDKDAESQKQVIILQGTVKLLENQIVAYKNMVDMTAKTSDLKDTACKEQIKAATPTFGQNMTKYLTGVGIGGILAGIAILLL